MYPCSFPHNKRIVLTKAEHNAEATIAHFLSRNPVSEQKCGSRIGSHLTPWWAISAQGAIYTGEQRALVLFTILSAEGKERWRGVLCTRQKQSTTQNSVKSQVLNIWSCKVKQPLDQELHTVWLNILLLADLIACPSNVSVFPHKCMASVKQWHEISFGLIKATCPLIWDI